MAAATVLVTQGTAPTTPPSGQSALFVNATKQLGIIGDDGLTLLGPAIRQAETLAVRPQNNAGSSASPTGNVSTTEKAMGLGLVAGFTITPQVTGNVIVMIAGMVMNSTAIASGTNVTGRYGTGTAPSNGATSGLGTQFGATQHFVAATTAEQAGFTVQGKITGLVLNVAVWFDLSLVAVTSGGSTIKDVQIVVWEV